MGNSVLKVIIFTMYLHTNKVMEHLKIAQRDVIKRILCYGWDRYSKMMQYMFNVLSNI